MAERTQVVEGFIRRLATAIAGVVAVILPMGFGVIVHRDAVDDLAFKAFVKASALSELVTMLPDIWQFSENRINGLIAREPVPLVDERVEVFTDAGEVLTTTGAEIKGVTLSRRAPLYDGAREVGYVAISRSATPLLIETGLVAILGVAIGALVQLVLQTLPLRALRRVTDDLLRAEERATIILSAITDAVVVTDPEGRITYLNPSATKMLDCPAEAGIGQPIDSVVRLEDAESAAPLEGAYALTLHERRPAECKGRSVLVRADGRRVAVDQQASPLFDRDASLAGVVLCLHDVSQVRELIELRSWEAHHDPLTGLFNRRAFEQRVDEALTDARLSHRTHVLLYLDLDRFKVVNDACGHTAGDQLLIQITGLIQARLRDADLLARLGGDEFGLLLMGCDHVHGERIAEALIGAVGDHVFRCQGQSFSVGVSIGMTVIRSDSGDVEQTIGDADSACYWAKDQGSGRIHVYLPTDEDLLTRRSETNWVARIHAALRENHFELYHQRIVGLTTATQGRQHCEILLRMRDAQDQIIAPGRFLPAAERYDLMPEIDRWVIAKVFASLDAVRSCHGDAPPLININLSAASVASPDLGEFIREQLALHGVDPSMICFEITETVALRHMETAIAVIRQCQRLGFSLALDDFGVGASSFRYLKDLPVEILKIDGSFVHNIDNDPIDRAMVETINHIAHLMGKITVAEHAENEAVIKVLREIGVDYAQGFGIDHPRPFGP
ncbi:EAL domain-containing protein [Thiorhodococcus mannitoliphagus]|uniref:EAL domain-containing protein n=1 Tax=Thiorhodococcus mannitoliphagus TaxID=329406 RepID=A0A6P1E000_9GAMM|nr:EAL domain-containing protein [Thiorhodococcus mannitoliphagus]NEX21742.1 EAL domain-containing protein [Thiorhodococcus mannitoliphagus]